MNFSKTNRNRLFFETSTIVIGFVVGYLLRWLSLPSVVDEMNFDEVFYGKKIYPDFMKSVLVMGITYGILVAVCLLAVLQLFFQRISDIGIGIGIPVFLFFSLLLIFLLAYILNTLFFYSEINLFLLLLIPLITIGALIANTIYIFYSLFSLESLYRFFTWPNWFCSIGLFSSITETWYIVLSLSHIPI